MRDVMVITKSRNTSRVFKGIARPKVSADAQEVRRGKKWFRYDAPDERLFKQLQKTLTGN
jgi:hypothetical protein